MTRIVLSLFAVFAVGLCAGTSVAQAGGHHYPGHHCVQRPIVIYPTVYPHPYYYRPYTFNPYSLYPQVLTRRSFSFAVTKVVGLRRSDSPRANRKEFPGRAGASVIADAGSVLFLRRRGLTGRAFVRCFMKCGDLR